MGLRRLARSLLPISGLRGKSMELRCRRIVALSSSKKRHFSCQKNIEISKPLYSLQNFAEARWVGQGMTNKEMARQMIISDTTVKTHLLNIFSKLKVGRRMQLPPA